MAPLSSLSPKQQKPQFLGKYLKQDFLARLKKITIDKI